MTAMILVVMIFRFLFHFRQFQLFDDYLIDYSIVVILPEQWLFL